MSTNADLSKPKHIISLSTSSLLVDVELNVWTATKQNRAVSDEVTTLKKATRDSGKFIENLLANDPDHKRVLNYRQTVYNWLQRRAYDFAGSQRILPMIDLPMFMGEYAIHEKGFYDLVDAFCVKYPTIVSNMAFSQGDLFDRNNYPDVAVVRGKFNIRLHTSEIPQNDWRNRLSTELADDLHNNYAKQTKELINNILTKQSEQVVNVMTSLVHCLGVEETIGKDGETKLRKRKIYDSTVDRALQLCNTFKEFNLTNNAPLEDARAALEKTLYGLNVDLLRENEVVREQVKDELDDILNKFRPHASI